MGSEALEQEVLEQCGDAVRPTVSALITELHAARRHVDRLHVLGHFEQEIDRVEGKEFLFERVAACMRDLFEVQRVSVTLVNESRTSFDIYALNQDIPGSTLVGSAIPLAPTAVGLVIDSGRVVNSPDISSSDYMDYRSLHESGMMSILHAPLTVNGSTIGCVNMAANRREAFDPVDEGILRQLTQAVGRNLEYRRLISEAQSASQENRETMAVVDRLRRLNDIARELKSAMSEREVLDVVARLLHGVVPFEQGRITVTDRTDAHPRVSIMRSGGVVPAEASDLAMHAIDADFQSIVDAPLFAGEAEIGLIRLRHGDLQSYTNHDRELLNQAASLVAATIHNIRLIKDAKDAQLLAEASSASKSTFVASVSHEIRTPLNAIIGMASLLVGADLGAENRQFVETIRSSGESLLAVVSEVLDFSKIEADKIELDEHPFDLRRCISDVVDLYAAPAATKGLRVTHELDDSLPAVVTGDVTRLRQVLVNLVGNASKFTASGEVLIRASRLQVEGESDDVEIQFTVVDSGIGMNAAQIASLFEPFVQGDNSTTRRYGGTGLGLAIARRLVELMGGRIWVESEVGSGSQFHFTACFRGAQSALEEGVVEELRDSSPIEWSKICLAEDHPLDILVAEDNKVNQLVMLNILARLGYRADVAADGVEVLAALDRQRYDVILMDMQMPEMDGLTAATRIRQGHSHSGSLQIIAVTANATQEDYRACLRAGMDDYLSKPIRIEDLVKALASAADRMSKSGGGGGQER